MEEGQVWPRYSKLRLLNLRFFEIHVLADFWIVFPHDKFFCELAGIFPFDVEKASAGGAFHFNRNRILLFCH